MREEAAGPAAPDVGRLIAEYPRIREMAEQFVHWIHARLVLRSAYPAETESTLRSHYEAVVNSVVTGDGDPRPELVFDPDLELVRGWNCWLDPGSLAPLKGVGAAAIKELPWCFARREGGRLRQHAVKTARALSTASLSGYTPIRPLRGVALRPDGQGEDEVVVPVPSRIGEPIRLLEAGELLPEVEAFRQLHAPFPGISAPYLKGLLAGAACVEVPTRPVELFVTGPTGSGKGQTAALAASFLGDIPEGLDMCADDEAFRRQIGSALLDGRRFLFCDELEKLPNLRQPLRRLLGLATPVTWRPLYVSGSAHTPLRAVVVMAHTVVPYDWAESAEFRRRVRAVALRQVPRPWEQTCGGDVRSWRSLSPANARVANSLLAHAARFAARHQYQWDAIADALGLTRPEAEECDHQVLIDLYRHCRTARDRRALFRRGYFGMRNGDWVDLRARAARGLLERLLPEDTKTARQELRLKLAGQPWNALLGIDAPDLVCEFRWHGKNLAVRFCEAGCPRGRERRNEGLPVDSARDQSEGSQS